MSIRPFVGEPITFSVLRNVLIFDAIKGYIVDQKYGRTVSVLRKQKIKFIESNLVVEKKNNT